MKNPTLIFLIVFTIKKAHKSKQNPSSFIPFCDTFEHTQYSCKRPVIYHYFCLSLVFLLFSSTPLTKGMCVHTDEPIFRSIFYLTKYDYNLSSLTELNMCCLSFSSFF